jgi:hypothetical protein
MQSGILPGLVGWWFSWWSYGAFGELLGANKHRFMHDIYFPHLLSINHKCTHPSYFPTICSACCSEEEEAIKEF